MGEYCCKIEALSNGYEVEMYDPAIAKKNSSGKGPYQEPWVSMAFKTPKEVAMFIEKNLEKSKKMDEYSNTFDMLVAQNGEDDE